MTYIEENSKIWDKRSENNDVWSVPVTSKMINHAREGVWSIVLTPAKPVPSHWFPATLKNKKILCQFLDHLCFLLWCRSSSKTKACNFFRYAFSALNR